MTIKDTSIFHPGIAKDLGADVHCSRPEDKASTGSRRFKLIDLFAGAGGMSLGFTKLFGHDFEHVWANDFNRYAATYDENFNSHSVGGDIVDLLASGKTETLSGGYYGRK